MSQTSGRPWRMRRTHQSSTVLPDDDLPVMFRSTDSSSKEGRKSTFRRTAAYLALLVVASVGSAIHWESSDHRYDYGALIAAAAFLIAFVLGLSTLARRPEAEWYEGRAGAESVKTLAWRYAVGGNPFPMDAADADAQFIRRLESIKDRLSDVTWVPVPGQQITPRMRELRQQPWIDRKRAYLVGRVDDQLAWYTSKAQTNRSQERRLSALVAVVTAIGVAAALAQILNRLSLDVMGIVAALAASLNAWGQAQQRRTLTAAYSIAAQELAMVRDQIESLETEAAWPEAVHDAEDAISREHTMWLARRGRKQPT